MTDHLTTYFSRNSKPEQSWLGYIHLKEVGRLNMAFFGSTEDEVKAKMKEFYAKDKAERDANRARREENRKAAAERAAKKKVDAAS